MIGWIKKRLDNSRDVCGFAPFNTGHDDPFHPACFDHDLGYKYKLMPREFYDNQFYTHVDSIIKSATWYRKLYLKPLGEFYKLMVRVFGSIVWNRGLRFVVLDSPKSDSLKGINLSANRWWRND